MTGLRLGFGITAVVLLVLIAATLPLRHAKQSRQ
jgi:hypothetical protein